MCPTAQIRECTPDDLLTFQALGSILPLRLGAVQRVRLVGGEARRFSMNSRLALMACGLLAIAALGWAGEPTQPPRRATASMRSWRRLNAAKVSIDAEKVNPDKVLDQIRKDANVNIVVDPGVRKAWETETVTLKLKDVSGFSALSHVLRQVNVAATYEEDALVITAPQAVVLPPKITMYPVMDIIEPIRGFRLPPTLFGNQIDPLFYYYNTNYWTRPQPRPLRRHGVQPERL